MLLKYTLEGTYISLDGIYRLPWLQLRLIEYKMTLAFHIRETKSHHNHCTTVHNSLQNFILFDCYYHYSFVICIVIVAAALAELNNWLAALNFPQAQHLTLNNQGIDSLNTLHNMDPEELTTACTVIYHPGVGWTAYMQKLWVVATLVQTK